MSLNVLVVDDSATMRKMITRTLHLSGLPIAGVYEASNGKEGLLALAMHRIDLALVDINMPEMDGLEMLTRIKANSSFTSIPVVVVSTGGGSTHLSSLLQDKGIALVQKPFTPERLSEVVFQVTGGSYGKESDGTAVPLSGPDF